MLNETVLSLLHSAYLYKCATQDSESPVEDIVGICRVTAEVP